MQTNRRNFWTVHLTHDTSPPKAKNKRYSEPDFKRSTTRTHAKSFLPGIFGLYLDLYIDFLAFLHIIYK